MDEKKQIEEMASIMTNSIPNDICKDDYCKDCDFYPIGKKCYIVRALYNAGYRKQSEGEWIDNHNGTFTCTVCRGRASKMNYCGNCGAHMRGGKNE